MSEAVIITDRQAWIIYQALLNYQEDFEGLINGFEIEGKEDIESLTTLLTTFGDVEVLKKTICDLFPIH